MPTGRYAPSPTGTFHMGNVRTAIAAWLFARSSGSDFVLRWEDLDLTSDPDHEASQRRDLERVGVDFEGPELRQSDRRDAYDQVIADLTRQGLTYRCWCSRREIREAAAAPHGPPGSYPGTCRSLSSREIAVQQDSGRPPALRLRTDLGELTIRDRFHGAITKRMDDIVLRRGDGTPAYNLAVVVDDEFQAVGEVVRGDDLLDSTPRHAYLQRLLGYAEPVWTHVPLVVTRDGERLAKRDGSAGIDQWLASGATIGRLIAACGRTLGIEAEHEATLQDLLAAFEPTRVTTRPAVLDTAAPELSLLH